MCHPHVCHTEQDINKKKCINGGDISVSAYINKDLFVVGSRIYRNVIVVSRSGIRGVAKHQNTFCAIIFCS